ncbi:hypothetical protein BU25DRAFT_462242 [Macroventuria anomochaeta]|uniref:Uncharacterized protein n=1 Tax=Macroventuria anomochaeta TaxID=301207 RepID=A0ACB6RMA5_9PLEO|nr:uncharacterized protein BU25DRAFT_462242 [Macroventuria anomochaeta]KAF2623090.1 hypothetical protein BU25DRAFT_462242 [Macroventuria anomochaeta]
MAPARDSEFLPEVWGLYSLGTLWIMLRFAVRLRTDGIRGLRLDDGFAFLALFAWTYTCAIIQITYYTGTNTDFTAAEVAQFDQKKYDEVVYGSKLFLGSWYAYFVLIFSLKAHRLDLVSRHLLPILAEMGAAHHHRPLCVWILWLDGGFQPQVLTLSSEVAARATASMADVFLLSVPISLLWNLNKPLRTRLAVLLLLASGVFVLAACIIRVSLTVVPNIFVLNIARWGVREFCIAIVAVNTASLQPMFRKSFWISRKPAQQVQQKRNNYMFASAQRARQRLSRVRNGNQVLNSTSAGPSTIDIYIQLELSDAGFVFEDPDYQMTSNLPPHAAPRITSGDMDLEKGGAFTTEIMRQDSSFPRVADESDEGDAGRSGSRPSQSNR